MVEKMMGNICSRCMWDVIHLSVGLPLLKNTLNSIDRVMRLSCLAELRVCHHFLRSLMLRVLKVFIARGFRVLGVLCWEFSNHVFIHHGDNNIFPLPKIVFDLGK